MRSSERPPLAPARRHLFVIPPAGRNLLRRACLRHLFVIPTAGRNLLSKSEVRRPTPVFDVIPKTRVLTSEARDLPCNHRRARALTPSTPAPLSFRPQRGICFQSPKSAIRRPFST